MVAAEIPHASQQVSFDGLNRTRTQASKAAVHTAAGQRPCRVALKPGNNIRRALPLQPPEEDHAQADGAKTKDRMTRTWLLPDWG